MVCNIVDIAVYQAIMIAAYIIAYQSFFHAWLIGCFHWSGERISLPVSTPDHPFSISAPCGWIYRKSFKRLGAEPPTNCPQSPRMWNYHTNPAGQNSSCGAPYKATSGKCQMLNSPFSNGWGRSSRLLPTYYKAFQRSWHRAA